MERAELLTMADELLVSMTRLTETLKRETASLYVLKNDELEALYHEKNARLGEYAQAVGSIRQAAGEQKLDLPAELNHRLKESAGQLTNAMSQNLHTLSVAKEASERVVNVIIDEVRRQRTTGAAYGVNRDGSMNLPPPPEAAAQAVTLDTRL